MGKALNRLKKGNHSVYFDASGQPPRSSVYLNEMQVFGGSVFTTRPQRYERTGAFSIARTRVAEQTRLNGRMALLLPGAAEEASSSWFYARPSEDFARVPVIVRSRF
jgi:hypothetical protein